MNENVKDDEKRMKGKMADVIVTLIFIIALVVIYFFWKCKWDLPVTILALVIAAVMSFIAYRQFKQFEKYADTINPGDDSMK